MVKVNSGGRVKYEIGKPVRILKLDGTISRELFTVEQARSDRRGHITIKSPKDQITKVHHRRVLHAATNGAAVVIESNDRYWAICPSCVAVFEFEEKQNVCPKCKKPVHYHWLEGKPMSTLMKKKKSKPAASGSSHAAPKPPKAVKQAKVKVDLAALAGMPHCELWTKKQIKFDHARMDVQAHTLIFTGPKIRKLCFNTYNGALGKKGGALPIEAFLADKPSKTGTPWFQINDLDKTRQKLQKEGYIKAKS